MWFDEPRLSIIDEDDFTNAFEDLKEEMWETTPEIYKKDAFYCHTCFSISRPICSWE